MKSANAVSVDFMIAAQIPSDDRRIAAFRRLWEKVRADKARVLDIDVRHRYFRAVRNVAKPNFVTISYVTNIPTFAGRYARRRRRRRSQTRLLHTTSQASSGASWRRLRKIL